MLAPVTTNHRWSRARQAETVLGDVFFSNELVEDLHHPIGKEMIGRRTEILLADGTLAVDALRGAIDGFAAGEDESLQSFHQASFKQVSHAEHIDTHAQQ